MLQLDRNSAPYSELDFPQFNSRGFNRVRQAVEVARQNRDLALSAEELSEATNALRLASLIKNAEQQVAQKNFEVERERSFVALHAALKRFEGMHPPAAKRLELENQLDHLITLFNLKDFRAVHRELGELFKRMESTNPGPKPDSVTFVRPFCSRSARQSVSSLFKYGLALERAGHRREAIEVYGQIVQRHSRHWQAIDRLRKIVNVKGFERKNQQRRQSCTRKYSS